MWTKPNGTITDAKILDSMVRFQNTANTVEKIQIMVWLFDHEEDVERALESDLAEDMPCGLRFDRLFFVDSWLDSDADIQARRYSELKNLCDRL